MWLNRCEWSLNILHDTSEKMEEIENGFGREVLAGELNLSYWIWLIDTEKTILRFVWILLENQPKIYMLQLFGHRFFFQTKSLLWIYIFFHSFIFIAFDLNVLRIHRTHENVLFSDFLMKFTNNIRSTNQINIYRNGTCLLEHFLFFRRKKPAIFALYWVTMVWICVYACVISSQKSSLLNCFCCCWEFQKQSRNLKYIVLWIEIGKMPSTKHKRIAQPHIQRVDCLVVKSFDEIISNPDLCEEKFIAQILRIRKLQIESYSMEVLQNPFVALVKMRLWGQNREKKKKKNLKYFFSCFLNQ